jgi:hypothetical protein
LPRRSSRRSTTASRYRATCVAGASGTAVERTSRRLRADGSRGVMDSRADRLSAVPRVLGQPAFARDTSASLRRVALRHAHRVRVGGSAGRRVGGRRVGVGGSVGRWVGGSAVGGGVGPAAATVPPARHRCRQRLPWAADCCVGEVVRGVGGGSSGNCPASPTCVTTALTAAVLATPQGRRSSSSEAPWQGPRPWWVRLRRARPA